VHVSRAYYYCHRCHQSYIPYDEVLGLNEGISPGLRPLVCLAGTLVPFVDAAEDVLRRFANVRLSASTVLRETEAEGERLRAQQKEGRMVQPSEPEPGWTAPRKAQQPQAYRADGWDIGSGPTEAGCKIIGERLKGSGMRWVEAGAATVAALRALYVSGSKLWDGFWQQPHRKAA
jgi:hypothetical protein